MNLNYICTQRFVENNRFHLRDVTSLLITVIDTISTFLAVPEASDIFGSSCLYCAVGQRPIAGTV